MMLTAAIIALSVSTLGLAAVCENATFDELKSKLKGKGELNLVFFASWCISCKPHLQAQHDSNVVFIAAFDEKPRAEKVLSSFGLTNPCFIGDDITNSLGIRGVPASKKIVF